MEEKKEVSNETNKDEESKETDYESLYKKSLLDLKESIEERKHYKEKYKEAKEYKEKFIERENKEEESKLTELYGDKANTAKELLEKGISEDTIKDLLKPTIEPITPNSNGVNPKVKTYKSDEELDWR